MSTASSKVSVIQLNDGRSMPQLGFGIWQIPDNDAQKAAGEAIRVGYRSIDGAAIYKNESGLGRAIKEGQIERKDLFITTKLWNSDQGYDSTLKAFDASLNRLGLEYVDMYLIHWPMPKNDKYLPTWKAMIKLREEGRAKSIGVSNFTVDTLERLINETGIVPAVNQIELHPDFQQTTMRAFHARHRIATESWSPLGQGKLLENSTLKGIAKKHGKTSAQVVIRWHLQSGLVVIPKSATPSRIQSNFDVFGFELDSADMAEIAKMDRKDGRIGPDPVDAHF